MFRKVLLITPLLFKLSLVCGQAPAKTCGTESTEQFIKQLKDLPVKEREQSDSMRTITTFPVTVWIIRQSDGTGGLNTNELAVALAETNARLAPAGISVTLCDSINYIDDDTYYDFYKYQENTLVNQYSIENTINLYIPNSITTGGGLVYCGYTYYPGWPDVMFIDRDCILDGNTMIHEFGHYFGLYHTHGISNVNPTDELANYSNCIAAGDDVCDTPADPNLSELVDTNCIYNGYETDPEGNLYQPDPLNLMSYAPVPCRQHFSPGQINRMNYVAHTLRDYLICAEVHATFDVSPATALCASQLLVDLTYTGSSGTEYAWDIGGDGSIEYMGPQVQHYFNEPGRYKVCLTVSAGLASATRCVDNAVQILDVTLPHSDDFDNTQTGAILNPDGHYGWVVADLGSNMDQISLLVDNYHYNANNEEDYYLFGPVDLTSLGAPVLLFNLAYAPYSYQKYDALKVEISTNCGASFSTLYYADGLDLSTTGAYIPDQWMPEDADDWREEKISLVDYVQDTVLVRFTNITGFGNNLYLDDISIEQDPLLAIDFISFEVLNNGRGGHLLAWETAGEDQVEKFFVERSFDGLSFSVIGEVWPQQALHNVYHYTHTPAPAMAFYRIRAQLVDGHARLSPLQQITDKRTTALVYPNPVNDILHLQLDSTTPTPVITVHNAAGLRLELTHLVTDHGLMTIDVRDLPAGMYTLVVGDLVARFLKLE